MTDFSAYYYDGRTAERHAVTVALDRQGYLVLTGFSTVRRFALHQVSPQPQLGEQPAVIDLPDGARVEIADADGFFAAWEQATGRPQWQHRLESRWSLVALVVLVTVLFSWFVYDRAIPAVANRAVAVLPDTVDERLGADGLRILDEQVFGPSALAPERQDELRSAMLDVMAEVGVDGTYELVFRDGGKAGANAFALPSGIVILTDQLVALAANDAELQAIMAHEIGHVRNRHALRSLLQRSFATGLLIVITGDIAAAGGLAVTLPTMLLNASYSREFEREADTVARNYLQRTGQPLTLYTGLLQRMSEASNGSVPGLLRTHPATPERIEEFLD